MVSVDRLCGGTVVCRAGIVLEAREERSMLQYLYTPNAKFLTTHNKANYHDRHELELELELCRE